MDTNGKGKSELLYPELSFQITGLLFKAHNKLGPYVREKQYGDELEMLCKENSIMYRRECVIADTGNRIDFVIKDLVALELKSVRILTKDDYEQVQRYLQASNLRLGILVNFRNKYIRPVRIVKIESWKMSN